MEETQDDGHIEENGNGNGNALKAKASEKVREIREAARGQASDKVRQITDKARERATEQVEGQRERIASRVDQAASSLLTHAENGDNLRFEAERRVGHGLESAAGYLHSHQTNQVAGDVSGYVHQHPVRSMIIAAVIGYLLGKLLS
jgi:ElaB/YqjD/DUF883 family membrane-anchored ribosome-binding protein